MKKVGRYAYLKACYIGTSTYVHIYENKNEMKKTHLKVLYQLNQCNDFPQAPILISLVRKHSRPRIHRNKSASCFHATPLPPKEKVEKV